MCCADYGLDFQKQFWKLLFSSSFEGWEHVSQTHKGCSLSWLLLSTPALPQWVCNLAFIHELFIKKGTFIWKLITGFILMCVWWGAEKRNCTLLILPEVQNRSCVRLCQLHPCRQRPWGGGAASAATMKAERPLTHLSLALWLLWALGPALALHFPQFWYLYFPLNTCKPLSNTSEWHFPMEHVINLVPSAKVSCHSSSINVRVPCILPLCFYRIFIVWCLPSCPGGTV